MPCCTECQILVTVRGNLDAQQGRTWAHRRGEPSLRHREIGGTRCESWVFLSRPESRWGAWCWPPRPPGPTTTAMGIGTTVTGVTTTGTTVPTTGTRGMTMGTGGTSRWG